MIIYLASYPRSGNTLCRNLIAHYLGRKSASVYQDPGELVEEAFRIDSDPRFRIFLDDREHPYRVLVDDCLLLLTPEFRQELAQSDEVFFVKTHEPPFDVYFDREYVIRIIRHPAPALWSYYLYLMQIEGKSITPDEVITGALHGIHWSGYTETWLKAEALLADNSLKVRYEDVVQGDEAFIGKVREWTGLQRKKPPGSFPEFAYWHKKWPEFYRRGQTDEWKEKLTPEQIVLIYQQHAAAMAKEGYRFDFAPPPFAADYDSRIHLATLGMADVDKLPEVPNAGQIIEKGNLRYQVMFNGVKVPADSYYGSWYSELIRQCRGHHEPQEEYVFYHLVKKAPEGATMIELGSYWGFYSTWFLTHVKNSRAVLVEPVPENLVVSLATLALNDCQARVILGAVGERSADFEDISLGGTQRPNYVIPLLSVDGLMASQAIEHLYLLHSDIQGAEINMLEGAADALENRRIDYLVISTHSNEIHHACLKRLALFNYRILAEHDTFESYTYDGLIVACSDRMQDSEVLEIHKRTPAEWTWDEAATAWADKDAHLEKHLLMLQGSTQLRERSKALEQQVVALQTDNKVQEQQLTTLRGRSKWQEQQLATLQAYAASLEQQASQIRKRRIIRLMRLIGRPLL